MQAKARVLQSTTVTPIKKAEDKRTGRKNHTSKRKPPTIGTFEIATSRDVLRRHIVGHYIHR